MAQQPNASAGAADQDNMETRSAPQTDPTNPVDPESVGKWTANEAASPSRQDEPGLREGLRGEQRSASTERP